MHRCCQPLRHNFGLSPTLNADDYDDLVDGAKTMILEIDTDLAITGCDRAIRIDPKLPGPYITRAWALDVAEKYDKSIEDCNTALKLKPDAEDESFAYNNRGIDYLGKRNYEKAIKDYKKSVDLDSKNAVAYSNLCWIHATCPEEKFRDGKTASEYGKKAYLLDSIDANIADNLAAYAEFGDFEQAVSWQEEALKLTNKSAPSENFVKNMKNRLELYKKKKPYRDE